SKLFGSSLRGNPYNLGFSTFHVNSVWCDPHLVDLLGDLLCLISAGSSGRTCVLLAVPYCWARAETLRGSGVAVKPERPFSGCHAPHSSVTWYSCRSTYVRRWLRRTRAAALGALPSERSHPSGDVGDVTPMQGDDPSGEVAVLALDEPALEEPCAQRLLIGPVQDRFGQVVVRIGARGQPAGDCREGAQQVLLVDSAQHRRAGRGEFADHHASSGADHPGHLGQGATRIVDIAQPEGDDGRVEGVVREGQLLGVGPHEGHGGTSAPALGHHPQGEVGGDHFRAGPSDGGG